MKNRMYSWLVIFFAVLFSIALIIPAGIPLKLSLGPVKIDRTTIAPQILGHQVKTNLGLDLQGGVQLVLEAKMDEIPEAERKSALESAREIIERRVNFFGVSEPTVQTSQFGNQHRIIVELPGLEAIDQAVDLIGQTAQLEFREYLDASESAFMIPTMQTTKETGLSGKDLKKAVVEFNQQTGEPVVSFELTPEGGKKFADLTTRLVGKPLPIFLDQVPLSAPTVQTAITEGKGMISGNFTLDSAKQLALQLSAGALPVPISIIEQKTVGATLGQESVEKSIRAGVIGLFFVAAFMISYYGLLGVVSVVGLIIYGLITFALFRLIPITLTLPGIAGFILSIGMAVDSNILIFSRLSEELRKGKPRGIALELAFGKAWDSIRDANITTILTALILFNPLNWHFLPASGMVRGFALTLLIGVLVSLFTGIMVSRNLIRVMYQLRKGNKS